jgi:phosphatidate cytidylyltransferase
MSLRELVKRLAVAALGIPLALGIIHMGGWPLTVTVAAIAALAARELYLLGNAIDIPAFSGLGVLGATALVLSSGMTRSFAAFAPYALGIVLVVFFCSAAAAVWLRWPHGRPLSSVPLTLAGVVYTGGGISFAVLLRHMPETSFRFDLDLPFQSELLLIFPLAVTWAADSAAYFFGHLFGNRKLIPSVSPGKTVVGGVAGLVTASLVGVLVCGVVLSLHPDRPLSALLGGIIGLLLGVAAQVGDLVESVLKREAGVKDSGTFFPGHGGLLDRFDATLYTLPLAYALIRLAGMLP